MFQAVVNYVYIYYTYIYIHTYVCIYIYIIYMYRYILYIIYIIYVFTYIYIYYRHIYLMIASSNLAAFLLLLHWNFSPPILSAALWSLFHVLSKRWHRKCNALSDARVVSLPKKECGFAVHFLCSFIKYLKTISNELLIVIGWSSCMFEVFIIK